MTDKMKIWYYIEGKPAYSSVDIPPGDNISDLINEIYKTESHLGYNPSNLILTKVCYIMISMSTLK